jgi:hypothetical protein
METENFYDLQPNPKNPRKISEHDFEALKRSILKFGDLSSIIKNQRTGHLVGGHMRRNAFEKLSGEKRVVITQRFDVPNRQGTVALGYVEHDNELFSYRIVDWDEGTEAAAAVAANRIEGSWDDELLAQATYDLSQLENGDELLKLTGQSDKEIEKLLKSVGVGDDPEQPPEEQPDEKNEKLSFALSPDQREVVELALAQAKQANDIPHTNLDNINGSALYIICRQYVETHTSQNIEQATDTPPADSQTPPAPDLTAIPAS